VRVTAQLEIRFLFANYCTRWRCNVKGLSQAGGRADLFLNLRASLFNENPSLVSAGSISLDSTFKECASLSRPLCLFALPAYIQICRVMRSLSSVPATLIYLVFLGLIFI
jgi:hypothetical protein